MLREAHFSKHRR